MPGPAASGWRCSRRGAVSHRLARGGNRFELGVQYAPTDNVPINSGSGSAGSLGQMWAWTVQCTGVSNINLVGPGDPEPSVLRIATPSSPGAACINLEVRAVLP